jgi:hypothetical protein
VNVGRIPGLQAGEDVNKQPLFPLADTPDVDLEQAGGMSVAVTSKDRCK